MQRLRKMMVAVLTLSLLLSVSPAAVLQAQDAQRITVDELKGMLGKPDVVLLDVRAEKDWDSSNMKIQGAVREEPMKAASWALRYPKEKTYVLYCA